MSVKDTWLDFLGGVDRDGTKVLQDDGTWVTPTGGTDAASVSFDPTGLGNTAATDVQNAISDLDGAISAGGTPTSRALSAGAGLTGGGDLTADRSFAVGAGIGIVVNADDVAADFGSGAGKVTEGNDARLSDSRAPSGSAGGVLSGTYPNPGFAVDMATQAELDAHTGDTSAAHAASAISADSTTLVGVGTDVQAVLEELDNGIADHLADASAAHAASAISFTPTGTIAATDVQAAIAEVASEASGYTDEQAQDAVGAIIADTATIDLTYTDATPQLKADVIDDSITNAKLANMAQTTIKGRAAAAGTGDPTDLTATQARTILDTNTTPSTQAFGDAATVGTPDTLARGDHKHAMPANPVTGGKLWLGGGSDTDINDAASLHTLFSQALTIVAGDVLEFEALVIILNNSGGTKTYTVAISLGATDQTLAQSTTISASATNRELCLIKGSIWVNSTSDVRWALQFFGRAPAAANAATAWAAADLRLVWNATAGDLTGAQTAAIKIQSSATGGTAQTATLLSARIAQMT